MYTKVQFVAALLSLVPTNVLNNDLNVLVEQATELASRFKAFDEFDYIDVLPYDTYNDIRDRINSIDFKSVFCG